MSSIATHSNLVLFQHERLNDSDPEKFKQGSLIQQKGTIKKIQCIIRNELNLKNRIKRMKRFELSTLSLARRCSTTELHPQSVGWK